MFGGAMQTDMTQGAAMGAMLRFAFPMFLGNLLQQCYNIVDTLIVGKYIGFQALAAVGSSFTLMTFLTSILLGLCMGSGTFFSIRFGERDEDRLQEGIFVSFLLVFLLTVALNAAVYAGLGNIRGLMKIPDEVWTDMHTYLEIIFSGILATFLYNYFASLLRAVGNSLVPLIFLAVSAVLNIALDFLFVVGLGKGTAGAAQATVIAQYVAGAGIAAYAVRSLPFLKLRKSACRIRMACVREIAGFSVLTCIQQSVMNLGILMVQGVVNSFGTTVMAAFAAAVKIDAFAYMPVQDFGNAFSTFVAQNYGARKTERIRAGFKGAVCAVALFCAVISGFVWLFARPLMLVFVDAQQEEVVMEGARYLRIEGAFYCGIGFLFLLYGLYRALGKPGMSVVLTVASLGTRVILAYSLSAVPQIGVTGIWCAVPVGWILADAIGFFYYARRRDWLLHAAAPASKNAA